MAIQYVGGQVGGRAGSTSTTNITFSLTGGLASTPSEGDLILIGVMVGTQGRNPSCAISGYSTVGTQLNVTSTTYDTSLQVSYLFAGATPPTIFTLPSTGNIADAQSYVVQVWRGVDSTTPFDVTSVSNNGTATTRANPASITPTTSGAVVVAMGGGCASTAATYTSSDLSAFLTNRTNDTNDSSIGGGYIEWTSGAVDPAVWGGGNVNSANSWASWTMALRPAAVGSFSTTGADATLQKRARLFYVIYPSAGSAPSATQIKAGQDSTGSAATASGYENARETTGEQIFASAATGLSAGTSYRVAFVWSDGTNNSNVVVSDAFSTTASATVLNAEVGTYSTTGSDANLLQIYRLHAESATFATSGADASLLTHQKLNAESTTYATTGADSTGIRIKVLNAEVGTFSTTGSDTTLLTRKLINAEAGSYTTTGADATLTKIGVLGLNAEAGTFATSGAAATLLQRHILNSEVGSYSTSGAAASLYQIYRLNAEVGAYSSAGADATLLFNQLINAQSTTFSTTGADATLVKLSLSTLNAEAGSFSTTGAAASLYQYKILNAASGTYETVGADATLSKISLSTLNAEAGSFTTVGADVTFVAPTTVTDILNAEAGFFSNTFAPAALYKVTGELVKVHWFELEYTGFVENAAYPGSFFTSPVVSYLYYHRVLSADPGEFTTSGQAVTFSRSLVFAVDPGSFETSGKFATLTVYTTAIPLNAEAGNFSTTGSNVKFKRRRRIKPIQDIVTTSWTPSVGSDVYATINDLDSSTYSYVSKNKHPLVVLLEDASILDILDNHTLRYSLVGNGFNITRVKLLEGDTVLGWWDHPNVQPQETAFEQELTDGQIAAITDASNLRLEFTTRRR